MVEVTHKDKTEEEEKVIEEVRKSGKQWMGETSMDEVEKPEPEGERVNLKINQIPAITFLEGNLPKAMLDELNAHVDEHREKMSTQLRAPSDHRSRCLGKQCQHRRAAPCPQLSRVHADCRSRFQSPFCRPDPPCASRCSMP